MSSIPKLHLLGTWSSLNQGLRDPKVTEKDIQHLLAWERAHERRYTFLLRLHQRYNVLRAQRERRELLS